MRCKAYGYEHDHGTVDQVREHYHLFYGGVTSTPPPARIVAPVAPYVEPITDKQVAFLERNDYKGDPRLLSKNQATKIIGEMIEEQRRTGRREAPVVDARIKLVEGLMDMVPNGYYATAPEGEDRHVDFVRITRPTKGKYRGAYKVQTLHGEVWRDAAIMWPGSARYWTFPKRNSVEMLLHIFSDYKTCAMRYAIMRQSCLSCGKTLTDDRSRHYLVGPICDKKHGFTWPIDFADEFNEMDFEDLQRYGKPYNQHHESLRSFDKSA